MKIILVVTSAGKKNFVFVTDDLRARSLKEAISFTIKGVLEAVHIVRAKVGKYLRSNPNAKPEDNLNTMSVAANRIVKAVNELDSIVFFPAFQTYWKLRQAYLRILRFAAAKMRERIDFWSSRLDIANRPDMVQYAYARGDRVTLEQLKQLDTRARQTRRECYPLAKQILREP